MVRIFKTLKFNRWMHKSKLSDQVWEKAVSEIINGLIDADLGKGGVKKRIPLSGCGKRAGARTLLATNKKDRWIFLYGFQKNEKESITEDELEGLQELASDPLELSNKKLDYFLNKGKLVEVFYENDS
jgi:hypothetical protein